MGMFTRCSGECYACGWNRCFAGNGDDDYFPATKKQIITRIEEGKYSSYVKEMKQYLMEKFNYDYDSDHENTRDIVKFYEGKDFVTLWNEQKFILKLIYGLPLSDEKSLFIRDSLGNALSSAISEKDYCQFLKDYQRYIPHYKDAFFMIHGRRAGASTLIALIAYYEASLNKSNVIIICPTQAMSEYNAESFCSLFKNAGNIAGNITLQSKNKMTIGDGAVEFSYKGNHSLYDGIRQSDMVLFDELLFFDKVGQAQMESELVKMDKRLIAFSSSIQDCELAFNSTKINHAGTILAMNTSECNPSIGTELLDSLNNDRYARF